MSPLTKGLILLFGIPVILTVGFFYYFHATGEERMRSLCDQVKTGMTYRQLRVFAEENNLRSPIKESGTSFLGESRSYGRHSCRVELENGAVKSAGYRFSD